MTDAGIEREYEQDLQAAARYLEVWVTFPDAKPRKVRTFMDTPEGRGVAAKVADEWAELPPGPAVEVRPVPVGVVEGRGKGAASPPEAPPAPTRVCQAGARLCVPEVYVGPSGKRRRHAWDCPDTPGEPIHIARDHAQGRTWPPRGVVRR